MGSTGHSIFNKGNKGQLDNETYGIGRAVAFKGTPPPNSGIDKPSANKVTLKIPITDKKTVLFQFKLSKDNDTMTIVGYRNGVPEVKAKVDTSSSHPSLSAVGRGQQRAAAKMRQLMQESGEITENQLGAIARQLLKKKTMNK